MADGEWRMANGEWRMANGEWRMANGEWRMANELLDLQFMYYARRGYLFVEGNKKFQACPVGATL